MAEFNMFKDEFTVEYLVKHIIYEKDGFYALKIKVLSTGIYTLPEEIKCGSGCFIEEVRVGDNYKSTVVLADTKYGLQFKFLSSIITLPSNEGGIKNFMVKKLPYIGKQKADIIYDMYGADSLNVIRTNPDALLNVRGISEKRAEKIYKKIQGYAAMEVLADFLFSVGVVDFQCVVEIYDTFKETAIEVIKSNPYTLCSKIGGSMLPVADLIAYKDNKGAHSQARYESMIIVSLNNLCFSVGHTCVPYKLLASEVSKVMNKSTVFRDEPFNVSAFNNCLLALSKAGQISMVKDKRHGNVISLQSFAYAESLAADVLCESLMLEKQKWGNPSDYESVLSDFESEESMRLDTLQKQAVFNALSNRVSIITGGPGTGKTTTVNAIIYAFEHCKKHSHIYLAAPTGRASKRMTELCDKESFTIHRLCGLNQREQISIDDTEFIKEYIDVLIVDEFSMVDTMLMARLLSAVEKKNMWVIFVGDAEQLPSVGPGLVLRDMIESGYIPVTFLETLFRQSEKSKIHLNADHIKKGLLCRDNMVTFSDDSDCSLIPCNTQEQFKEIMKDTVSSLLKSGTNPEDISILCPMRKGSIGSVKLNEILRELFNPRKEALCSFNTNGLRLRVKDRVMQTVNNYNLGEVGVFNGEIGEVAYVDNDEKTVTVTFNDMADASTSQVLYEKSDVPELELAYALTVHKSQGSEMPIVIIPALDCYNYDRNLLYTAISRAKRKVIFIGKPSDIDKIICKQRTFDSRITGFLERLDRAFSKKNRQAG